MHGTPLPPSKATHALNSIGGHVFRTPVFRFLVSFLFFFTFMGVCVYGRVLVGFMRDWFLFSGKADRSEPLLILEVRRGRLTRFFFLALYPIILA